METPQLYARLKSKSRDRVLCGVMYCRGELGIVSLGIDNPDDPTRWLNLPAGWTKRGDGVYCLSNYARNKMKAGRAPQHRRRPKGMGGPNSTVFVKPQLPCVAECPICRRPQILDPARLDVVPVSAEMRTGWQTQDLGFGVVVGTIPGGLRGLQARLREARLRDDT